MLSRLSHRPFSLRDVGVCATLFWLFTPIGLETGFVPSLLLATVVVGLVHVARARLGRVRGRQAVLFLRRFGVRSPNVWLADAVDSHLAKHFTVVALDNGRFTPRPSAASLLTGLYLLLLPAVMLLFMLLLISISIPLCFPGRAGSPRLFDPALVMEGMSAAAPPMALVALVLSAVQALVNRLQFWREVIPVEDSLALDRLVLNVQELRQRGEERRGSVPIMLSARCADEVWQQTISALTAEVDAIVVDVSHPGEGVLWELEHLAAHAPGKVVFIGDRWKFRGWSRRFRKGKGNALENATGALLQEHPVLLYGGLLERSRTRFSNALLSRLQVLSRQTAVDSQPRPQERQGLPQRTP
ncbi:hypothetical protein [Pyxidicoccus caerfyrddinensis]|uniref:hypothetical protein n=1 Tax=Pyxidicoccus caerfyrddinensis TaxID=2709663 RepID=UPI0013DB9AED|nr:hypothetical protein [Pyxidicoccus caerfyrddinensis]